MFSRANRESPATFKARDDILEENIDGKLMRK